MKHLWFIIRAFFSGHSLRDMAVETERHITTKLRLKLWRGELLSESEEAILMNIIQKSRFPETRKELDRIQAMMEGK